MLVDDRTIPLMLIHIEMAQGKVLNVVLENERLHKIPDRSSA